MGEVYRAHDSKLKRDVAIKVLPAAFTRGQGTPRPLRARGAAARPAQPPEHRPRSTAWKRAASRTPSSWSSSRARRSPIASRRALCPSMRPFRSPGRSPKRSRKPTRRASSIATSSPRTSRLPSKERSRSSTSAWPRRWIRRPAPVRRVGDLARSPTLMNSPTLTAAHGTQLGVILGTAAYMAPEQARGGAVDKRADIWAFGVVLFEMLTGRSLFAGDTVSDTLAGVLKNEIDSRALPAATPAGAPPAAPPLPRAQRRGTGCTTSPTRGSRSTRSLAGGPEEPVRAAGGQPRRAAASVWRRSLPWLGRRPRRSRARRAPRLARRTSAGGPSAASASIRTLVAAGVSLDPSVSPDGRTLAFDSTRDGEERIWIKDLTSGSESVLVRRPSALPAISPDGTSVLYTAGDDIQRPDLYRTSLATREERLVARTALQADWSPDGKSVVFVRVGEPGAAGGGSEIVAIDLEGGRERVLHRDPQGRTNEPRWSPDGRRIALVFDSVQAGANDRIGLLDVASGALEELPLDPLGRSGIKVRGITWISPRRLGLLLLDSGESVSSSGRIAVLDLEHARAAQPPAARQRRMGPGRRRARLADRRRRLDRPEPARGEARRRGPLERARAGDRGAVPRPPAGLLAGRPLAPLHLEPQRQSRHLAARPRDRRAPAADRPRGRGLGPGALAGRQPAALQLEPQRALPGLDRRERRQLAAPGDRPRERPEPDHDRRRRLDRLRAPGRRRGPERPLEDPAGRARGARRSSPAPTWCRRPARTAATSPSADPAGSASSASPTAPCSTPSSPRPTATAGRSRAAGPISGRSASSIRGPRSGATPSIRSAASSAAPEIVLDADAALRAETLGVARDGSAFTFASFANRRGQLIRIDGLTGLAR